MPTSKIDDLTLRQARPEELPILRTLEQKVVDAERPFNDAIKSQNAIYYDLEELLTNESACMLVAEDASDIVATGYAQVRTSKVSLSHEKHVYLGFMFVDEAYRGLGLNKLILDNLINWGKEQGLEDFYLDVYAENQSAIRAYEKAGFSQSMVEMKLHLD